MRELVTNRSQALHLLSVCLSVSLAIEFTNWILQFYSFSCPCGSLQLFSWNLWYFLWYFLMNSTWNILSESCERFCEQISSRFLQFHHASHFHWVVYIAPLLASSTANFLLCFFYNSFSLLMLCRKFTIFHKKWGSGFSSRSTTISSFY
jgi:hypothetical protein